jgi:hypothetical protein
MLMLILMLVRERCVAASPPARAYPAQELFKGGCPKDAGALRRFCWRVAAHPYFLPLVIANISINIMGMSASYYGSPRRFERDLASRTTRHDPALSIMRLPQ